MASLSLSVLSTTRMMNCRVGGKNHTDWPLFKKTFTAMKCNTAGGHFRAKSSTMGTGDCYANNPFLNEREWPCMTKDQRHVNVGEMSETPFKPKRLGKRLQPCALSNMTQIPARNLHESDTVERKSEVTIVTVGLLQSMVPIVTIGLLVTLL